MKFSLPRTGFALSGIFLITGCLLVLAALWLFTHQLASVTALRARSMQLGDRLTELKTSIAMLRATTEAERFYGSVSREAFEEQASVYVLPQKIDTARTIRMFSSLTEMVSVPGSPCSVKKIIFDGNVQEGETSFIPTHVSLHCNAAQLERILGILGYTGKMIVADVLKDHAADFLLLVQEKAPVSLPDAYALLNANLLTYAASPEESEGRLLGSLPVQDALDVQSFLLQSGMSDVRAVLSGPASILKDKKVWPLPLLTVDRMTFDGGDALIDMKLFVDEVEKIEVSSEE